MRLLSTAQMEERCRPPIAAVAVMRRLRATLHLGLGTAACVFALTVVWHTLAFLAAHRPVLPIYDGWAPWSDLDAVLHRRTPPFRALVGRHNEHRVLLAGLLFLVDLLDGGRDRVSIRASLAAQAVQVVLWSALLWRAGVDRPTRWLLGGAIVAMLFTLRQGDNFVSGFQVQFTGVFALNLATAVLLLPRSPGDAAPPCPCHILAGSAGLLLSPFAMANGLLAGPAYALAALADRSPGGRRVACLAVAITALSVVVDRALPSEALRGTL